MLTAPVGFHRFVKQQDALGNFANPDRIATPDNLKFSEQLRTLFICEDSNTHGNNFLWAYNRSNWRRGRPARRAHRGSSGAASGSDRLALTSPSEKLVKRFFTLGR